MKAKQLVVTKKNVDLDIAGITLLSAKEYLAAKKLISSRHEDWWLRSFDSGDDRKVGIVNNYGTLSLVCAQYENVGVSPALRIQNLRSFNLIPGEKVELAGHTWTVIADDLVLCDDIVGHACFRKDRKAKDANDYEASDIKKWLEAWAAENGIVVNVEPATA